MVVLAAILMLLVGGFIFLFGIRDKDFSGIIVGVVIFTCGIVLGTSGTTPAPDNKLIYEQLIQQCVDKGGFPDATVGHVPCYFPRRGK